MKKSIQIKEGTQKEVAHAISASAESMGYISSVRRNGSAIHLTLRKPKGTFSWVYYKLLAFLGR